MNGTRLNHLFYADDAVLLASSPTALQKLLDICSNYASLYELKYNSRKTKCMTVKPYCYKKLSVPDFYINDTVLSTTEDIKYLGCFITDNLTDDKDINRQIRCLYTRGNILISKFRHCSAEVKAKLFKSYCSSFYGSTVWMKYNHGTRNKLIVAYKKIFRAFFSFKREGTTFNMLNNNINPLVVILRNCLAGFIKRIHDCDNVIVYTIVNSVFYHCSQFYSHFTKVLYI